MRKPKRTRKTGGFTMGKALQLLCGTDYFGDGFGNDLTPEVLAAMKADWVRHKHMILADPANQQAIEYERKTYGSVWAERQFEGKPNSEPVRWVPVKYEVTRETR